MKRLQFIKMAGALLVAGLALYVFFSARSCVKERRWLALGPIENHPVRIWDVNFAKEFNDINDVQLAVAQAVGVPPVADKEEYDRETMLGPLLNSDSDK